MGVVQPKRVKERVYEVRKSALEWRGLLTPEQYIVCREKGTERAFSGAYWNAKDKGIYHCVCCGQALFKSDSKFNSGCGWPSFSDTVDPAHVNMETDHEMGVPRTEVICSCCGAHLGHVFDDGPAPTGKRYCINSVSLELKA